MEKRFRRKRYSREFKREAVLLLINGERSADEIDSELGISAGMLHRWRREYLRDRDGAFPGKGHLKRKMKSFDA